MTFGEGYDAGKATAQNMGLLTALDHCEVLKEQAKFCLYNSGFRVAVQVQIEQMWDN